VPPLNPFDVRRPVLIAALLALLAAGIAPALANPSGPASPASCTGLFCAGAGRGDITRR